MARKCETVNREINVIGTKNQVGKEEKKVMGDLSNDSLMKEIEKIQRKTPKMIL